MRLRILFLSSLFVVSCAHPAPPIDSPLAVPYYRQELAKGPTGQEAVELRASLEEAEFVAAKKQGTILALRTFLDEFPDGAHQREARTMLEALRWNEASADGSIRALRAFVEAEPHGTHAPEAWTRLRALELDAAIQRGDTKALRAWKETYGLGLQPPPPEQLARENTALAALELQAAKDAPIHWRRARLQAWMSEFPSAVGRDEAQELEAKAAIAEAALLGDRDELRNWIRSGRADAAQALAELDYSEAAARFDETALGEIARASGPLIDGPIQSQAKARLAALSRDRGRYTLGQAARALYLPAQSAPEAGDSTRARARRALQTALGADGSALGPLATQLAQSDLWASEMALEAFVSLLDSLPDGERAVRAARLETQLEPIARDGVRLSALALVRLALGETAAALEAARSGAATEPRSLVAWMTAARIERTAGEAKGEPLAVNGLLSAAESALNARPQTSAGPSAPRGRAEGDGPLWPVCAILRAAREANADAQALDETVAPGMRERAAAMLGRAERAVTETERQGYTANACAGEDAFLARERKSSESIRADSAKLLAARPDLAAEALQRASLRDPAPEVRALLHAPAWRAPLLAPRTAAQAPATIAP